MREEDFRYVTNSNKHYNTHSYTRLTFNTKFLFYFYIYKAQPKKTYIGLKKDGE